MTTSEKVLPLLGIVDVLQLSPIAIEAFEFLVNNYLINSYILPLGKNSVNIAKRSDVTGSVELDSFIWLKTIQQKCRSILHQNVVPVFSHFTVSSLKYVDLVSLIPKSHLDRTFSVPIERKIQKLAKARGQKLSQVFPQNFLQELFQYIARAILDEDDEAKV